MHAHAKHHPHPPLNRTTDLPTRVDAHHQLQPLVRQGPCVRPPLRPRGPWGGVRVWTVEASGARSVRVPELGMHRSVSLRTEVREAGLHAREAVRLEVLDEGLHVRVYVCGCIEWVVGSAFWWARDHTRQTGRRRKARA